MNQFQPCIAIDVPKGKSLVCGYSSSKNPQGKVFSIRHNLDGFMKLDELYKFFSNSGYTTACFIFESTGIYHRTLRRYLELQNYDYIEVSPLLSAKHRKNSTIRSAKTDARDTHSRAKLFYDLDFDINVIPDEIYYELQQYHRYYLELIKMFPHPSLIVKKRVDAIESILLDNGMQERRVQMMARHIKEYCTQCCSGSGESSVDTFILVEYINMIQELTQKRENLINKMIQVGSEIPLYTQLLSIPGIGPNTSICLVAELGDLSRFESSRQLVAYAGLDSIVYQSGNQDGNGLAISKKGNRHLRYKLFQVMTISANSRQEHRIKESVQKKRQTLSTRSAYIAGCDKLLKIIFRINQTGELYKM